MSDASTLYFSVTDLIWFHDTENPTDPDPAPGVVTAVNGDNIEVTLDDGSTQTIKPVAPGSDPVRWIERRDRDGGELEG